MKTKVFTLNKNNKIEFTEKELRRLLDEIYNDGYYDGKNSNSYYYYTTPYRPYPSYPYYTWCSTTSNGSTINTATSTKDYSNSITYTSPSVTSDLNIDCDCKKNKEK